MCFQLTFNALVLDVVDTDGFPEGLGLGPAVLAAEDAALRVGLVLG
jgi:hypothetical protein